MPTRSLGSTLRFPALAASVYNTTWTITILHSIQWDAVSTERDFTSSSLNEMGIVGEKLVHVVTLTPFSPNQLSMNLIR